MTSQNHVRTVSRPAFASVDPVRLFVLDIAIGILNFIGRVKF